MNRILDITIHLNYKKIHEVLQMAERRMIAKSFVNSATFMKMSDSAKLLYFYLNVNADDDGMVEVFPYYKMLSIPEDDVRNLAEKEFIVF